MNRYRIIENEEPEWGEKVFEIYELAEVEMTPAGNGVVTWNSIASCSVRANAERIVNALAKADGEGAV